MLEKTLRRETKFSSIADNRTTQMIDFQLTVCALSWKKTLSETTITSHLRLFVQSGFPQFCGLSISGNAHMWFSASTTRTRNFCVSNLMNSPLCAQPSSTKMMTQLMHHRLAHLSFHLCLQEFLASRLSLHLHKLMKQTNSLQGWTWWCPPTSHWTVLPLCSQTSTTSGWNSCWQCWMMDAPKHCVLCWLSLFE